MNIQNFISKAARCASTVCHPPPEPTPSPWNRKPLPTAASSPPSIWYSQYSQPRCSSTARPNGAVPRRVTTVMYYDVIPQPTSGNILTQYRHPRVQHDTLGQHFRAFPLPKGAGQNEVWMKETLRQRKPYLSLPEGTARLSWATLSYFIVARGYSTALLGNTFVLYRRPRVQHGSLGQHFRTSSLPECAARRA